MRVTGATANLPVSDIASARLFYTDYLGLGVEEMNLGWGRSVPVGRRALIAPARHA